jgi:transposase
VLLPRQQAKLARGAKDKEHAMSQIPNTAIAVIGIDIGKNSFHVVGHDVKAKGFSLTWRMRYFW